MIAGWNWRHWAVACAIGVATALLIGVPTGIVHTPIYTRMTPVLWWNYPVWAITSALEGLLAATYVRAQPLPNLRAGRLMGGGLLSGLAVGCPICNKLVVIAVGVSGALNYWAPLQPVLAVLSLALLGFALRQRARYAVACPTPTRPDRA